MSEEICLFIGGAADGRRILVSGAPSMFSVDTAHLPRFVNEDPRQATFGRDHYYRKVLESRGESFVVYTSQPMRSHEVLANLLDGYRNTEGDL